MFIGTSGFDLGVKHNPNIYCMQLRITKYNIKRLLVLNVHEPT